METPSTITVPVSMRVKLGADFKRGSAAVGTRLMGRAPAEQGRPRRRETATLPPGSPPRIPKRDPGLAPAPAPARARDPRPPPRALRAAGQPAARAPDRRAGAHRPLPEHQRPQPRRRLRPAARALPDLGAGPRRADRGGRGGDQAGRPERHQGAPHPGDPRAARRPPRPRLARRGAARARRSTTSTDLPGVGPQDRGLRPDLRLRPTRRSRSTPTSTGSAAGSASSGPAPPSRRPTTRCSRSPRPRTPTSSTST